MHRSLVVIAACSASIASSAEAQVAPAAGDVVRSSDDGFGRRIGVEEIGIYSEGNVRGFDLQEAGNFRIDDHYFVRSAAPINPVISGTAVRIGANALRYDFPAPSGVYEYRLKGAQPGAAGSFEIGFRGGNGGPIAELSGSLASASASFGIAGGVQIAPWQKYADGSGGTYFSAGAVPRWVAGNGATVTGLLTRSWWTHGGDTLFATDGSFAPPHVKRWINRGQPWADARINETVAGLIIESGAAESWTFGASLFRSESERARTAFTLLTLANREGDAANRLIAVRNQASRSWSGEATVAREFLTGGLTHRLIAMVRARDSRSSTGQSASAELGLSNIVDEPLRVPERELDFDREQGHDHVVQYSAGIGYRLSIGDAIEMRADLQKARYRKSVRSAESVESANVTEPWLYGLSLVGVPAKRLVLFASYTKGLEESGIAPFNAINRNAVLPAALATQAELGAKYSFPDGPSLIAGLFDIEKPIPGLGPDGVYGLIGEVRHRGIELSVAGPLTDRLSVVAGATKMKARLSGLLADSGIVGPRPIGKPETIAVTSLTWRVPGFEDLSIDGGINYRGGTPANRANSLVLSGYATLNLGLRKGLTIGGRDLVVRARITNLLDHFAWQATSSGLFFHNGPRAYTLTLNGDL